MEILGIDAATKKTGYSILNSERESSDELSGIISCLATTAIR